MRFEDFETMVARHGTDPSHWPDPDLARPRHVMEWLAQERAYQQELEAALPVAPLSANFADRTLEALPSRRTPWPLAGGAVAAALLAAVFVWQPLSGADAEVDEWTQLAEETGFGELYDWVEG